VIKDEKKTFTEKIDYVYSNLYGKGNLENEKPP
jgi:hypothetical protein